MSNKLGVILSGLGAFLVAMALLSRFYVYDQLAVVPLDQDTVSVSEGPGAVIFDIATQQEITLDLVSTRNVFGDVKASKEASDKLNRDIAVWETLVYTDEAGAVITPENPPRSSTNDRVAFDRHTGESVNCCDTFTASSADENGDPIRDSIAFEGLYFKFPFQTKKETYEFWDDSLGEATDIEFKAAEKIDGLTVYRFEQVIPPTNVAQIFAPASLFGIDEEGDVTLDRIYSNTRTLWVEPETGVIIRGQEDQLVVAQYKGDQVATLTDVTIGYNPATIAENVDTYSALSSQLKVVRIWLPVGAGILGLLLLVVGIILSRSRRKA